jgi:hypothetical protein
MIPYTLDLPLVGLFLPFFPYFHFWDATRVYLDSGVYFYHSTTCSQQRATNSVFGLYIKILFRQEIVGVFGGA